MDLSRIADNLVRVGPGFWTAVGHHDRKFIQADETDWLAIEDMSFWYRHRNRVFVTVIGRYPAAGPIFDIGAGNGAVALALQKTGYEVIAVEPTARSAANASSRGVRHVVCAGIEDAGLKRGALANTALFDVLEHIPDDASYLSRLRQLMPAGGLLYCAVPAWPMLWSTEDDAAEHCRRYSMRSLSRVIASAGFDVLFTTYYFAALLAPILLLRALPSRLGLARPRSARSSLRDHTLPEGLAGRAIQAILDAEISRLASGNRVPIGASCFVIARAA